MLGDYQQIPAAVYLFATTLSAPLHQTWLFVHDSDQKRMIQQSLHWLLNCNIGHGNTPNDRKYILYKSLGSEGLSLSQPHGDAGSFSLRPCYVPALGDQTSLRACDDIPLNLSYWGSDCCLVPSAISIMHKVSYIVWEHLRGHLSIAGTGCPDLHK